MKNVKFMPVAASCLIALLGLAHPNAGWAKSVEETVKGWIENGGEALKRGTDDLGQDFAVLQEYLDHYNWKGLIEDKATSGPATLKHLELNEHSRVIVVKPGEKIKAEVKCLLDSEKCSAFGLYRIVVGINDVGPQAVVGHELGLAAGKTREKFTLTAPTEPGMYEIRFRPVEALLKTTALDAWTDEAGNQPDGKTTIGIIFVKQ